MGGGAKCRSKSTMANILGPFKGFQGGSQVYYVDDTEVNYQAIARAIVALRCVESMYKRKRRQNIRFAPLPTDVQARATVAFTHRRRPHTRVSSTVMK